MNLGLESLHALAAPTIEAMVEVAEGSVYDDLDFSDDLCDAVALNEEITDLKETIVNLTGVCNVIKEKGCSRELIALCGEELSTLGIDLSPGAETEATASLEALIGGIKLDDIKKALMKIVDMIVRIIEKIADHNKRDTTALTGLIEGRLSDIENIHREKFSNVVITAYPKSVFMNLVNELSNIDLEKEVGDEKSLKDALSTSFKSLLTEAGWEVTDTSIVRADNPTIKREKTKTLGWDVSHLRDAAMKSRAVLQHLRIHDIRVTKAQRQEVNTLKGDTEDVDKARNKLQNLLKTIMVTDRLSLILSRQIIAIVGTLKDKN